MEREGLDWGNIREALLVTGFPDLGWERVCDASGTQPCPWAAGARGPAPGQGRGSPKAPWPHAPTRFSLHGPCPTLMFLCLKIHPVPSKTQFVCNCGFKGVRSARRSTCLLVSAVLSPHPHGGIFHVASCLLLNCTLSEEALRDVCFDLWHVYLAHVCGGELRCWVARSCTLEP